MSLTKITAPAKPLLPLNEIKAAIRLGDDDTDEDALLAGYIEAATAHVDGADGVLGRALLTQTWDLKADRFPAGSAIRMPLPPLQSVTSISYIDTDGVTQIWAASNYDVDTNSTPGRILPAFGAVYPTTRAVMNAVTVRFVAGYGDDVDDVPETVRLAATELVSHWFENREPVVNGTVAAEMPFGIRRLLAPYKVGWFGS